MTQPINLGIIGAGLAVKQLHWPALRRLRDRYRFGAVADIDLSRAQEIAALVGAEHTCANYHELLALSEVEAVLLSLPIHLTAPIALDAARAGKHLIIEKPLGSNLEQARQLKEHLAHLPVTALVAENFRYRNDLAAARRLVHEGTLGDLLLVRLHALSYVDPTTPGSFASTPWRHDSQYRGGPILDASVHHAAALRTVAGEVEWVQAFAKYGYSRLNGPTTISMNLRFRSGALGSYLYSVVCHDERSAFLDLTIYGSEATLVLHDGEVRLLRREQPAETIPVEADDGGYYAEFLNFAAALREDQPIVATVDEAYKDMELILRALDSAEQAAVLLL
ncbi:MAG TPA: Gfo/Idh/MocA family oxidoreductase [Herpetosiphonaceae bacterium]